MSISNSLKMLRLPSSQSVVKRPTSISAMKESDTLLFHIHAPTSLTMNEVGNIEPTRYDSLKKTAGKGLYLEIRLADTNSSIQRSSFNNNQRLRQTEK